MRSVVQAWLSEIPIRMQAVLLLGLRGPDTARLPETKKICRWLRGLAFRPGNPENVMEFMNPGLPQRIIEKGDCARELEFVTQHYYTHLMHALQVVANRHPDDATAGRALDLYFDMCALFHLPMESQRDFEERLKEIPFPGGEEPEDADEAMFILRNQ